jgi:hypothetical protein
MAAASMMLSFTEINVNRLITTNNADQEYVRMALFHYHYFSSPFNAPSINGISPHRVTWCDNPRKTDRPKQTYSTEILMEATAKVIPVCLNTTADSGKNDTVRVVGLGTVICLVVQSTT